jgi:hypothetical protein
MGPGMYTVSLGHQVTATLSDATAHWTNGSGWLNVSTWTSSVVAGTFEFTMHPVPGSTATGMRTITAGTFNLTF